ncbi:hypothetical protein HK104_006817 [Borealophlyctis nickersoniae]|nr:hypothetical protein HK104_006817 [Borealophlyctis nickersoniae]
MGQLFNPQTRPPRTKRSRTANTYICASCLASRRANSSGSINGGGTRRTQTAGSVKTTQKRHPDVRRSPPDRTVLPSKPTPLPEPDAAVMATGGFRGIERSAGRVAGGEGGGDSYKTELGVPVHGQPGNAIPLHFRLRYINLQKLMDATPVDPNRVWDAFKALCNDPAAPTALNPDFMKWMWDFLFWELERSTNRDQDLHIMGKIRDFEETLNEFGFAHLFKRTFLHAHILRNETMFDVDYAKAYLDYMKEEGVPPNLETFICVARAMGRNANGEGAETVMTWVAAAGLTWHPSLYGAVMLGYSRAGLMTTAMDRLRWMKEDGVAPTTSIYATLMAGYVDRLDTDSVLKLFGEMKSAGLQPDRIVFNVLLDLYCKTNNMEAAREILSTMQKKGIASDIVSHNTMITGMIFNDRIEDALEVFYRMLSLSVKPDEVTYHVIMKGLADRDMVGNALRFYHLLLASGLRADVYHFAILMGVFSKAGSVDSMRECLTSMTVAGVVPNARIYQTLIQGYCQVNDLDEAFRYFRRMKAVGISPTPFAYRCLIQACYNAKNYDKMFALYNEGKHLSLAQSTLKRVISALCSNSRIEEAAKVLSDAIATGTTPTLYLCIPIPLAYASRGNFDQATTWVSRIRGLDIGVSGDAYARLIRHATIARNDAAASHYYKLLMEDNPVLSVSTIPSLVRSLVYHPDLLESLINHVQLHKLPLDSESIRWLIVAYRMQRQHRRAFNVFGEYVRRVTGQDRSASLGDGGIEDPATSSSRITTTDTTGTTGTTGTTDTVLDPGVCEEALRLCVNPRVYGEEARFVCRVVKMYHVEVDMSQFEGTEVEAYMAEAEKCSSSGENMTREQLAREGVRALDNTPDPWVLYECEVAERQGRISASRTGGNQDAFSKELVGESLAVEK